MASLGQVLAEGFEQVFSEIYFHKRSVSEKKKVKRARRRAHRNTNFKSLNQGKPKKGYKRVKVGDKRYMFQKMSGQERIIKQRVGRALGRSKQLR